MLREGVDARPSQGRVRHPPPLEHLWAPAQLSASSSPADQVIYHINITLCGEGRNKPWKRGAEGTRWMVDVRPGK